MFGIFFKVLQTPHQIRNNSNILSVVNKVQLLVQHHNQGCSCKFLFAGTLLPPALPFPSPLPITPSPPHRSLSHHPSRPRPSISHPSLFQPILPSPSLPSSPSPSFPLSPLEVGPLNPARGPGECCKLPQWGLGQSPSRN